MRFQLLVFGLVGAAFTTIYITQPVLPVLREEFAVGESRASLTISAVIFGIALSNLPWGSMADRHPVRPIVLLGGSLIAICGFACAMTDRIWLLIGIRFVQGLFLPCVTTCVAAYLSRTLPQENLNVVMGSYVAATVAGGLGGRLLGGLIHPPLHWRYAFVTSSVLLEVAAVAAWYFLPREQGRSQDEEAVGFLRLITRVDLLRVLWVAFGAFFVFSSMFNYLPFYLATPELGASTTLTTLMYSSYLIGIVVGPLSGKLSNRVGNGTTMVAGSAVFGLSICATLIPSLPVIAASLAGICAGFFAIHAAAAGSLNTRLNTSRGRANSLYVLFYYLGGFAGISAGGYAYVRFGWSGIAVMGLAMLLVPMGTGVWELINERGLRKGKSPGARSA
ncbi:MAG: MFS transporter [Thermodesulfobacteriota bacterium]